MDKVTDNPFRSDDLGVMSPARCLCAMSVSFCRVKHFIMGGGGGTQRFPSILPKDNKFSIFAISVI